MPITPIYVGDTSPLWHNTFLDDSGNIFPLSGLTVANLSMHFLNLETGVLKLGTGTWTITNAPAGKADYALSTADTNTAGVWKVYPVVMTANGPQHMDYQIIEILSLP
jgi:hypothetical protein